MAHSTISFVSKESPHTHVDWSDVTDDIRIVDMRNDKIFLHVDRENCQKLIDGLTKALKESKNKKAD